MREGRARDHETKAGVCVCVTRQGAQHVPCYPCSHRGWQGLGTRCRSAAQAQVCGNTQANLPGLGVGSFMLMSAPGPEKRISACTQMCCKKMLAWEPVLGGN